MAVVYRIANADRTAAVFFSKKGDAIRAMREQRKRKPKEDIEVETLKVIGRDQLVALLNNPAGGEEDVPDTAADLL